MAKPPTGPSLRIDRNPPQPQAAQESKLKPKVPERPQPKTVVISDDEAIVVIGRIQKPEVFYVLARTAAPEHALFRERPSFIPEIKKSVKQNPF